MSVVSCLPISRGTVAVSVRSGSQPIYLDVMSLLLTWTTLEVLGSALGEVQSHRQGGFSGWMCWQLESPGEIEVDVTVTKRIIVCSEDPGRQVA